MIALNRPSRLPEKGIPMPIPQVPADHIPTTKTLPLGKNVIPQTKATFTPGPTAVAPATAIPPSNRHTPDWLKPQTDVPFPAQAHSFRRATAHLKPTEDPSFKSMEPAPFDGILSQHLQFALLPKRKAIEIVTSRTQKAKATAFLGKNDDAKNDKHGENFEWWPCLHTSNGFEAAWRLQYTLLKRHFEQKESCMDGEDSEYFRRLKLEWMKDMYRQSGPDLVNRLEAPGSLWVALGRWSPSSNLGKSSAHRDAILHLQALEKLPMAHEDWFPRFQALTHTALQDPSLRAAMKEFRACCDLILPDSSRKRKRVESSELTSSTMDSTTKAVTDSAAPATTRGVPKESNNVEVNITTNEKTLGTRPPNKTAFKTTNMNQSQENKENTIARTNAKTITVTRALTNASIPTSMSGKKKLSLIQKPPKRGLSFIRQQKAAREQQQQEESRAASYIGSPEREMKRRKQGSYLGKTDQAPVQANICLKMPVGMTERAHTPTATNASLAVEIGRKNIESEALACPLAQDGARSSSKTYDIQPFKKTVESEKAVASQSLGTVAMQDDGVSTSQNEGASSMKAMIAFKSPTMCDSRELEAAHRAPTHTTSPWSRKNLNKISLPQLVEKANPSERLLTAAGASMAQTNMINDPTKGTNGDNEIISKETGEIEDSATTASAEVIRTLTSEPAATQMHHSLQPEEITVDDNYVLEQEPIQQVEIPGTNTLEKLRGCLKTMRNGSNHIVGCRKVFEERKAIQTFLDTVVKSKGKRGSQGKAPILHICGAPGSGKSMIVNKCCKEVIRQFDEGAEAWEPRPKYCYVNCAMIMSFVKPDAVEKTLEFHGCTHRQLLRPSSEDDSDRQAVVFVLDEIDMIVVNRPLSNVPIRTAEKFIQTLLQWAQDEKYMVGVIGVSNSVANTKARRLQGLGFSHGSKLVFKPYGTDALIRMALSRIGTTVVDEKVIEFLAKKVSSGSGDARKFLELLSRSVMHRLEKVFGNPSEENKLMEKPAVKVLDAIMVLKEDAMKTKDLLETLPRYEQMVLCLCIQLESILGARPFSLNFLRRVCMAAYEKTFDEKTTEDNLRGLMGRLVDSGLLKLRNFDPQAPTLQLSLDAQLEDVKTAVEMNFMKKNIFQQMATRLKALQVQRWDR